ncbi:hypothetical protein ACET3Z_013744 [Daucus carota]
MVHTRFSSASATPSPASASSSRVKTRSMKMKKPKLAKKSKKLKLTSTDDCAGPPESCPYLNGKYCEHNGSSIPRMLNWTTDYSGRFDEFYTTLSLDSVQLQLKKITPTAKEINELDLGSLVGKSKNVIIRNKETSQHDSDDDFVEPVGRAVKGVSSVEVVSRSAISLSSKSEAAIKNRLKELIM